MTLPRVFIVVTILLISLIGFGVYKKRAPLHQLIKQDEVVAADTAFVGAPIEIDLKQLMPTQAQISAAQMSHVSVATEQAPVAVSEQKVQVSAIFTPQEPLPMVNHVEELFQKNSSIPIVETIRYKSRVSWKPGRAAWLIDYAFHYKTPLDFIARSINGKRSYTVPTISDGISFNILRQDKNFYFHIIVDLSRNQLALYYVDTKQEKHGLLGMYRVSLGRLAADKVSGSLTPLGKFKIGSRIAIIKPKVMGLYRNKRVELIRVFGTRWIPFDLEVEGCTEPAKGLGLHGTPWSVTESSQTLVPNDESIGKYESDGCIRMRQQDIEELYSIVTTRDCFVEIVKDFNDAKISGELL